MSRRRKFQLCDFILVVMIFVFLGFILVGCDSTSRSVRYDSTTNLSNQERILLMPLYNQKRGD